jgi:hypothetical protein
VLGLAFGTAREAAGQTPTGYRVVGNSVRVDQPALWSRWNYQNDLVGNLSTPVDSSRMFRVDASGMVPVFFRHTINAALDAPEFTYNDVVRAGGSPARGGVSAQTNQAAGTRILDDDLTTYWEPSTPLTFEASVSDPQDFDLDGLRKWELVLDLGRLVYVDSVTVVFPAGEVGGEYLGEPVKSFALLASMGERFPFPLGTNLKFTMVGQLATGWGAKKATAMQADEAPALVTRPGTNGRAVQVTFPLVPLDRADWDLNGQPDIGGSFVQYLQLKVTDSDLWRHFRVGSGDAGLAAYNALPAARRGAKVYQRMTAGGVLVELQDDKGGQSARQKYEALPADKRGPIIYYGKEVPRISELQVWAKGDNYCLKPEKRAGGSYENGGLGTPNLATDGIYDSEWQANTWSPLYLKGTAWWDFGAVFWVDNVSVINKYINQSFLGAFYGPWIRVSDGTLLKPLRLSQVSDFPQLEEGLKWDDIIPAKHVDNHIPQVRMFQETFEPRKIRFMTMRDIDITGAQSGRYGALATPCEVQMYGEGYPVSVWAYSPPISLTDSKGNFIRKTLPRIAWDGDVVLRSTDPVTGRAVETIESLDRHSEVKLELQTRTSDQTDTTYTYFEVVDVVGSESRTEISKQAYDELALRWAIWNKWSGLAVKHKSSFDDDGDGAVDEDPINFIDDDNDGRLDEDGKALGKGAQPKSKVDRTGAMAFVGWSEWSNTYLPTGGRYEATITSPNPRKFLQIRLNVVSDDPMATGRIRSLRVDLAPPLALELVGEVAAVTEAGKARDVSEVVVPASDYAPPTAIDPLSETTFSYFLRAGGPDPADAEVRNGFDEMLLVSPRPASLRAIRLGTVQVEQYPSPLDSSTMLTRALTSQFSRSFVKGADGAFKDASGQALEVRTTSPESIYVKIPVATNKGLAAGRHALVEMQFSSRSFDEGLEFSAYIRDSRNANSVFQRVDSDAKDATELVDSRTARVSLARSGSGVIHDLKITQVATPNGDAINDRVVASFTILRMLTGRPVEMLIHDLQGALVGKGGVAAGGILPETGAASMEWDCRDTDGQLVPPGIYLCRIRVRADAGDDEHIRLVHVAY